MLKALVKLGPWRRRSSLGLNTVMWEPGDGCPLYFSCPMPPKGRPLTQVPREQMPIPPGPQGAYANPPGPQGPLFGFAVKIRSQRCRRSSQQRDQTVKGPKSKTFPNAAPYRPARRPHRHKEIHLRAPAQITRPHTDTHTCSTTQTREATRAGCTCPLGCHMCLATLTPQPEAGGDLRDAEPQTPRHHRPPSVGNRVESASR